MCVCLLAVSVILGILIPQKTINDIGEALEKQQPYIESLSETPTTEEVKLAVVSVATLYGLDKDLLLSVVNCESSFRYQVYGDNGKAFSVAQFHKPTFDQFCEGNYYSAKDQLMCMGKMFKDGYARHWSCYKNLTSK